MAIDKKAFSKTKYPNIKIHKNGIRFWFDFTIAGRRYTKLWDANPVHTKADRLRQAQNQLQTFRDEIIHNTTISADAEATVLDYWNKLKNLKRNVWGSRVLKDYVYYFNKHLIRFAKLKIKDVKSAHLTSLNASLSQLSKRSQKKAYEILIPLFDLAVEDEIIPYTPIKKSHKPKRKQLEEKKIVTDAVRKYKAIHNAIHRIYGTEEIIEIDDTKVKCRKDPMYRAIFLFGFYGRRIGEVVQLKWDDIDFDNDEYTVRGSTSKVNTDMTFKLPTDVREALLEFKDTRGEVFPIKRVDRQYWKIRAVTGIKEFNYHWMRNLSVSALAAMGVDITHLSAMLGHTDSGTIKKYLSLQREASTAVTNEVSKRLLS